MALTNRHRLSILIGFLVISEIFYITLMIKLPDDIMQREKAQSFVEQVGKYIPKIRTLQQLAQRDVVLDVMPIFYAVVCLWCFSVGLVVSIMFKRFRLKIVEKPENAKQLFSYILLLLITVLFVVDDFFRGPSNEIYRSAMDQAFYGFKGTAVLVGAPYTTVFYVGFMYLLLNVKKYILFLIPKGEKP